MAASASLDMRWLAVTLAYKACDLFSPCAEGRSQDDRITQALYANVTANHRMSSEADAAIGSDRSSRSRQIAAAVWASLGAVGVGEGLVLPPP